MNKIQFVNGQAPALNETNLNLLQENIELAISDAIEEADNNTTQAINDKIKYGTSLPASATEGTIFLLYNN